MTKINHKEYEILKGLDNKWKWIARDENNSLWAYSKEPDKKPYGWLSLAVFDKELEKENFQFIQWEDEEPWNIQELIEEYESEEKEVKNIEWLKEEITEILLTSKKNGTNYFYYRDLKEKIYSAIDRLGEPKILSQEITEENGMSESEWAEVIDRYKWHLEQEGYAVIKKPTIPQFVADFLIGKEEYMLYELLDNDFIYDDHDELARWLYNKDEDTNKERELSLVLAHIRGYKLEKEQKYFAKIKGHENVSSGDKYWNYCITDESLDIGDNKVHADVLAEYVLSATKDEWENLGINDGNAEFVEVEELEE